MGKDFAFLFYVNDWAGGTAIMNRLQRGGYLDLLLYQFQNREFSLDEAKLLLGDDFETVWKVCEKKFDKSSKGLYFHRKMRDVMSKRAAFTESRRKNKLGKKKGTSDNHVKNISKTSVELMENENESFVLGSIYKEGQVLILKKDEVSERLKFQQYTDRMNLMKIYGLTDTQYEHAVDVFCLEDKNTQKDFAEVVRHFIKWTGTKVADIKETAHERLVTAPDMEVIKKKNWNRPIGTHDKEFGG